ncbi:hypothetical protein [Acinetobacter sp. YH01003]|uniref:hypothetical protein n=1 Tax=Acinetobacter sp. YH01003 TaxID=2601019 RepID=UPI0015D1E029|nr:hypothetical protein [Acinetobacter sp. YH01003]
MNTVVNTPPNSDDEDDLPTIVAVDANNYLDSKAKDEELLRDFKSKLFWVGLVISCIFLAIGLCKSYSFIDTQLDLAKSALVIQQKQLEIDEQKIRLLKDTGVKPEQIKELNLLQDREEKVLSSKLLSTGVILTLITVIFAVALTILLNLIKHTFKNSNEGNKEDSTELATPLGNLILDFITVIKERISK